MTSALTRRQAVAGGAAALVPSPFIIRPGFAQRATVNIGVIQPLSGANAQFGVNCRNGIELVADEINAAGGIKALGGAKINLVVSDATSNPTVAPAVAQRLIVENDLTAVIGAFASSLTLAISEVTARADIPFVTQAFADEITGRGLESVFQVTAKASVIGRAQVNYTIAIAETARSKIEKIAIMYEDTAYGIAQSRGLRRAAKDANIEVVNSLAERLRQGSPCVALTVSSCILPEPKASGRPVDFMTQGLLGLGCFLTSDVPLDTRPPQRRISRAEFGTSDRLKMSLISII
jgi:ABC-type branched-subunit amino acid transport system substrate-binding protein